MSTVVTAEELRGQLPAWMPGWGRRLAARAAMSALALDAINALYARCAPCRGGAFAAAVLDDLGIRLQVDASPGAVLALARWRAEGRPWVVVANHPFGALDGIALLAWATALSPDFRLMANSLLQRVDPLRPCLLAVDPLHPGQAAHNRAALHQAYRHVAEGGVLGLFPSGRVATWSEVHHPERATWRPQVQKMLDHLGAPVLPVHLGGRNSVWFYLWGLLGWRVRSLALPREVFRRRGTVIRLHIGEPLTPARSDCP